MQVYTTKKMLFAFLQQRRVDSRAGILQTKT